jgi:Skp family chaperone for outer membrane proteins
MKGQLVLWGFLACVVAFSAGSISGGAKTIGPMPQSESTIAVVRVVDILREWAGSDKKHMQELIAQQNRNRAELEQRARELRTEEEELRTLKTGSEDYLKQLERLLEMKARLEGRKEFLDRELALKQQLWTQRTFAEIVQITRELAAEKGFHLVLAADPLEVPPSESIAGIIATQKVLYSSGCPDLTDEVKARLAAGNR